MTAWPTDSRSAAAKAGPEASTVTVVCACDEHYAMPTAVMLQSLAQHADPARRIEVGMVDYGISPDSRERIMAVCDGRLELRLLAPASETGRLDTGWGHVSSATYDRLFLTRLLDRDSGKALWLDGDLLVLDDICRLFDQSLEGCTLGAVKDPLIGSIGSRFGVQAWRELDLPPGRDYFNAGVLLVDLERWESGNLTARTLEYLRSQAGRVFFHDQEALNAMLWDDWRPVGDRWNHMFNRFHARRQQSSPDEAAIVHFAGRLKPWNQPGLGGLQDRWFENLDQTGWRGSRPRATVAGRLSGAYLNSPLRSVTYPLENLNLWLRHRLRKRAR